jgi:hypothetical protein
MRKLFDDLARGSYGHVARAKALVHTTEGPYRFDITYGKIDYVRFDRDVVKGRLVVIGQELDPAGIGQAVQRG